MVCSSKTCQFYVSTHLHAELQLQQQQSLQMCLVRHNVAASRTYISEQVPDSVQLGACRIVPVAY